jgi:glycine/D-amino acid oxidase-like deaminating enzyme/nitrite reductase/ring-hydroxylating ferredoxin subunit
VHQPNNVRKEAAMVAITQLATPTRSIWSDLAGMPAYPALDHDIDVDIAVVGAGITGLTAATLLSRAGRDVALLEAQPFGHQGTTHRTTAHLTTMLDQSHKALERRFGREGLQHAFDCSRQAIDLIERMSREFAIDCDFARVPGWFYCEQATDMPAIEEDFAIDRQYGLEVVLETPALPFAVAGGMRVENQAQFHPMKYLTGLARNLDSSGCGIWCDTVITNIDKGKDRHELRTASGHRVRAAHVVLATHSPAGVWLTLHTRLVPYRSYVLVARIAESLPAGLYWDTGWPFTSREQAYHYIRRFSSDDGHTIVIGGEDHKTGHERETQVHFEALEQFARARFTVEEITHHWSAEWFEPADGLPYIGTLPGNDRLYVATGYSGTGMTYGTAAAMLISDLILERNNPWTTTFTPARLKPIASAPAIAQEAVSTIKGLADRFIRVRKQELSSIPPGEGRVISYDGKSIAVHRDETGALHACSATCPHMGCIVQWNAAEHTWDCPCHGSIFDAMGEVLSGPATTALKPEDLSSPQSE